MKGFVGAAMLVLALAAPAWGQKIVDGRDIADYCDHHPADAEASVPVALALALCYGFLKGVGDAHALAAEADGARRAFCLPGGSISSEQSRLVFLAWSNDHREQLDLPAAAAVTAALRERTRPGSAAPPRRRRSAGPARA